MTDTEDSFAEFLSGWFFDVPVDTISRYDVRDFLAWSMFEGRHQEHLTIWEVKQLESFCYELEYFISLELYGEDTTDDANNRSTDEDEPSLSIQPSDNTMELLQTPPSHKQACRPRRLPQPKKMFHFLEERQYDEPSFFTNLYDTFHNRYEQMKQAAERIDFHPVQDLKNLMAETRQHIVEAEESAIATGRNMYEKLVPAGVDRRLTAMSQATYSQIMDAWNSVKNIPERIETARFLSLQRQRLQAQLKGYRLMLDKMLERSSAIPSKQMAGMMRRVTEVNESLERLEKNAQSAFSKATGYVLPFLYAEPQIFAKYSSDPLLGVATYPLGFHLFILTMTEVPLRILMSNRGFERCSVASVSYYFHPGSGTKSNSTPIVFVHGIGIGLIMYISLIDEFLKTGRPILLPEIPYVSGFRFWQSPHAVLQPAVVTSIMTAMLASHGFMRGTWVGHSYGTSWLSYMVKYASHAVAGVCFLDPICFCLHYPRLTKSFVYEKPDPGTISYIVRTDLIVNWTIQRAFPWSWIILFLNQIQVPCHIYLSDKDMLVPAKKIEDYLRACSIPIRDFGDEAPVVSNEGKYSNIACTVFRGDGHGEWTEKNTANVVSQLALSVEDLCKEADVRLHED